MSGNCNNNDYYEDETKLILAENVQSSECKFVNPPVYRGSTILFDNYESMNSDTAKYVYGRWATPTSDAFCETVTKLEGGIGTIVTCSGLAAITTTLLALVLPGSHILISESSYPGALNFSNTILAGFNVIVESFSTDDAQLLYKKIRPNTALVYIDMPGNYGRDIFDLRFLRKQIDKVPIIVDNTWATLFYYNPIKDGADIVIHSTSKYIAGHSDSIMGCIVFKSEDMYLKVRDISRKLGQYAGADDLNLALRGLKTLSVRMKQHYNNALEVANWLLQQDEVEKVLYPPLKSAKNHIYWAQQFRGGGGLLSFIFRSKSEQNYVKFLNNLKIINLGWGWGGYESLASASTINCGDDIGRVVVRLSVGLEATSDIINDLQASFSKAFS